MPQDSTTKGAIQQQNTKIYRLLDCALQSCAAAAVFEHLQIYTLPHRPIAPLYTDSNGALHLFPQELALTYAQQKIT